MPLRVLSAVAHPGRRAWVLARAWAARFVRGRPADPAGRQAAVLELQARLSRALEGSADAIWEHSFADERIHVSERFCEMLGLSAVPVGLTQFRALVHPHDLPEYMRHTLDMIERGLPGDWESRFRTGAGGYRWLRIRGRVARDAHGQPFMRAGTFSDVHEQRSARDQLRALQARYERALDGTHDVVWERDLASGELFVSEQYAAMLGIAASQVPVTIEEVFANMHPDDVANHALHVKTMMDGRDIVTWEVRLKVGDGSFRWFRVRGRCLADAAGRLSKTSGTLSDVHEAREANERLREVQGRLARALKGASDAIWERKIDSDAFFVSERFAEILGYPEAELPVNRAQFIALLHPEDLPRHMAEVTAMLQARATSIWECRFRMRDGRYRWLRLSGGAVRDERGEVVMTSGTASDIHEARLASEELKLHRDHLARLVEERTAGLSQAMRAAEAARRQAEQASLAKSEFLANMSHELRTPMHAVISFAGMGVERSRGPGLEKLARYFANIESSASRLKRLLDDLLDMSKIESGKMQYHFAAAELQPIVLQVLAEFEAMARARGVRLDLAAACELPRLRLDKTRIHQVIANLVSNAVKFTAQGSRVELVLAAAPGGRASLAVADQGPGIPEDEVESVFEKFFQSSLTKTGAGGTGLGLAISRDIAAAHGGQVTARNRPGGGALFELLLPMAGFACAPAPASLDPAGAAPPAP